MAMYADGADYTELMNDYMLAQTKFADGNFLEAAKSFEKISTTAMAAGIKQGPRLLIETGRAYLFGGEADKGLDFIKRGLAYLAQSGRRMATRQLGENVVYDFKQRGLSQPAQEISAYLVNLVGDRGDLPINLGWNPFLRHVNEAPLWGPMTHVPAAGPAKPGRPILPTRCPACGAPIAANDVDWVDDLTAECPFCGSLVRGEAH
jgi:hypothetical protein